MSELDTTGPHLVRMGMIIKDGDIKGVVITTWHLTAEIEIIAEDHGSRAFHISPDTTIRWWHEDISAMRPAWPVKLKSLGQVTFEEWLSTQPHISAWTVLTEGQRHGWEAAALAAIKEAKRREGES